MTARDQIVLLVLAAGAGWLMFHIDRYQGCFGESQVVELAEGASRPIACNSADMSLTSMVGEAPAVQISCDGESHRATLYGASPTLVACGISAANLETWQGGARSTWNARVELTWKK